MKTQLLFAALSVSITACAVDSTNDTTTTDDTSGSHQEKLAANALSPEDLAASGITAAKLTQTVVNTVSATREGRAALYYLVNCAMPSTYSITGQYNCHPVTGVCQTATYVGGINLVPTWTTSNLNQTSQRTLSGCVLGRMNEYSRSVTVSLRGAGYTMDSGEAASHIYPEGVFFGNLFPGSDNYWGACDSDGPTHVDRQCAQPGHCSVDNTGLSTCATACSLDASGNATSCVGANGKTYANPTTVFLDAVSP
jgi:hypothetical protein